jgi:hypothetical protein
MSCTVCVMFDSFSAVQELPINRCAFETEVFEAWGVLTVIDAMYFSLDSY